MEDLIDIQGLDAITWWPLAWTWWLLLAICLGLIISASIFAWHKLKYKRSWQYRSYKRLEQMHSKLANTETKKTLQSLSLELRKIAMQTTQRSHCASLVGKQWLRWLEEHDPTGFAWTQHGELLVNAQYMPDAATSNMQDIGTLILAAQGWVKKC